MSASIGRQSPAQEVDILRRSTSARIPLDRRSCCFFEIPPIPLKFSA